METECVHIRGTVMLQVLNTGDVEYTVTCDHCHAAWLFGLHPAGMQLFDVYGERFY